MERTPLNEHYALTINEAAEYFSVGTKKLRRLAESHLGEFAFMSGNRYLIIRTEFERFLKENCTV